MGRTLAPAARGVGHRRRAQAGPSVDRAGGRVSGATAVARRYVADCYLCPGNERVSGARDPWSSGDVYVFDNDHPSVGPLRAGQVAAPLAGIYRNRPARGNSAGGLLQPQARPHARGTGAARGRSATGGLAGAIRRSGKRTRQHRSRARSFENKGEVVGVSNPHPHCQIYADEFRVQDH